MALVKVKAGYSDMLKRLPQDQLETESKLKLGEILNQRNRFEIDANCAYLYTKGYIPELDAYPGVHVPAPFEVTRENGDTSIRELCNEILALTKLNWNTADFCCRLPITNDFVPPLAGEEF